jgi:hypothetical protein
VNISPLTAPLATGDCKEALSKVADPLLLHDHDVASPPVSFKVTSSPTQIGPLLLAVQVGLAPALTVAVVIAVHAGSPTS